MAIALTTMSASILMTPTRILFLLAPPGLLLVPSTVLVLALLERIPPSLLALLLGRLGTALPLRRGSRLLLRVLVGAREDSGWVFCSLASARETPVCREGYFLLPFNE